MHQQKSKLYNNKKKTNTAATNVTSTALINYHNKKVSDSYILHTYMYNKKEQYKMENNEFKKVRIKSCKCYYFDNIIKLDFDLNNILIDE